MPISSDTARDIAFAYREVETAEALLNDIVAALDRYEAPDLRDAFGRPQQGLQLGVPRSETSRTCYHVPWSLARPILEAHIANQKVLIRALSEKARLELDDK